MPSPPVCARCGYNLSGAADAWSDCCPLEGTCPECGSAVDWRAVFNNMAVNERFVEHSRGVRATFRAAVRTWLWTFWPPLFWRRVRPTMPTRPWRWMVWALVVLLVPRVLVGAVEAAGSFNSLNRGTPSVHPGPEVRCAFWNGVLGPWLSVGMEPVHGFLNPPGAPAPVLIRMNVEPGLRIPATVRSWVHDHQVPPGLLGAMALMISLALTMRPLWLWADGRAAGARYWRAVVFGGSWIAALCWVDLWSASSTLVHSFDTPLNAAPLPASGPAGAMSIWPLVACRDVEYRPSTLVWLARHTSGLWLMLVVGAWLALWWIAAARAALVRRPPMLAVIAVVLVNLAVPAGVLMWNYDTLMGYLAW